MHIIAPGTKAIIDLTDDVEWCHIRANDGKAGWFHIQERRYVSFSDNADVQTVFDGLLMAD